MLEKPYADSKLKVFSLSSNRPLAEKIASKIGVELGELTILHFSDGEIKVNIDESIRGDHVYLIQSTSDPVNNNLMELLITIDALRRASAKTINIVVPYYGYARQDRKARSREPITAKLVANLLSMGGIDRMITLDLHTAQVQGFFDIPIDHMLATPLLAKYFIEKNLCGDDVVVVSPDHSGVSRARKLADYLKSPIAIVDKRRSNPNVIEVKSIVGDVEGKTCILVDDMIVTGYTTTFATEALVNNGAKEVYACCTHAVLSKNATDLLQSSPIKKIVVTDSINIPEVNRIDKIDIISVDKLFAKAIRSIHENKSIDTINSEYKG